MIVRLLFESVAKREQMVTIDPIMSIVLTQKSYGHATNGSNADAYALG